MNIYINLLKEKILIEYQNLKQITDLCLENFTVSADDFMVYSEYFFVKYRIFVFFKDFSEYLTNLDTRVISFLLSIKNASDFLTFIYVNGLAENCDIKSVEGTEKLMIYAYNYYAFHQGNTELLPVELSF